MVDVKNLNENHVLGTLPSRAPRCSTPRARQTAHMRKVVIFDLYGDASERVRTWIEEDRQRADGWPRGGTERRG